MEIKERSDEISGFAGTSFQGKILCVTNRKLCQGNFLERIESIARASHGRIGGIILREKDLPEAEYRELARKVMEICEKYGVCCILHNFAEAAAKSGAQAIHLPLPILRRLRGFASVEESSSAAIHQRAAFEPRTRADLSRFRIIGASCHFVEDALEAQSLGCTYITAGHVFATDCKKGVPPRGLAFLREICGSVSIPVYAIGGIKKENYPLVLEAGAAGACIMSGLMCCENIEEYLEGFCGQQ